MRSLEAGEVRVGSPPIFLPGDSALALNGHEPLISFEGLNRRICQLQRPDALFDGGRRLSAFSECGDQSIEVEVEIADEAPFVIPEEGWMGRGERNRQRLGNGMYETVDPVTREQLDAILFRYAKGKGYDVSVGEDTNILSYDDALTISCWAFPAMQWACGAGILSSDGTADIRPTDKAMRSEIARAIHIFCGEAAK